MTAWLIRTWHRLTCPTCRALRTDGKDAARRALYPYLASFLDDPQVGPLLKRAADERWTPEQLEEEVRRQDWWRP